MVTTSFAKSLKAAAVTAVVTVFLTGMANAASFTQKELAFMPATTQLELFKQGVITPVVVLKAQIAQ